MLPSRLHLVSPRAGHTNSGTGTLVPSSRHREQGVKLADSFERDTRAVRELTRGFFIVPGIVWLAAECCGYKGRDGGKGGLEIHER